MLSCGAFRDYDCLRVSSRGMYTGTCTVHQTFARIGVSVGSGDTDAVDAKRCGECDSDSLLAWLTRVSTLVRAWPRDYHWMRTRECCPACGRACHDLSVFQRHEIGRTENVSDCWRPRSLSCFVGSLLRQTRGSCAVAQRHWSGTWLSRNPSLRSGDDGFGGLRADPTTLLQYYGPVQDVSMLLRT